MAVKIMTNETDVETTDNVTNVTVRDPNVFDRTSGNWNPSAALKAVTCMVSRTNHVTEETYRYILENPKAFIAALMEAEELINAKQHTAIGTITAAGFSVRDIHGIDTRELDPSIRNAFSQLRFTSKIASFVGSGSNGFGSNPMAQIYHHLADKAHTLGVANPFKKVEEKRLEINKRLGDIF